MSMEPITERLAEPEDEVTQALRMWYCDGAPGRVFCQRDKDSMRAIIERARTHPAEGGEGRTCIHGYVATECPAGCIKAPPPQPVAPERGEAKAVAWMVCDGHNDKGPDAGCQWIGAVPHDAADQIRKNFDGQTGDAGRFYLRPLFVTTPQPPPAPTFRDPTIEDAKFNVGDRVSWWEPGPNKQLTGTVIASEVLREYTVQRDGKSLRQYYGNDHDFELIEPAALNAIGAKVEE